MMCVIPDRWFTTATAAAVSGVLFLSGCISSTVRYGVPTVEQRGEPGGRRYDSVATKGNISVEADRLKKITDSYLGTPYRYGGISRSGVDCSGLVCLVFRELADVALPRSAVDMMKLGAPVQLADLRSGDLLFFRWGLFGSVDHVGIYLRDGTFVHASSKHGVIESSINDEYYRSHCIGARRLFQ